MEAEVKQVIKVVICFQISIFEPLKTTNMILPYKAGRCDLLSN